MNTLEVLAAVHSLQFPFGDYIIMGGSSLAVRGARATRDLDILVNQSLFNTLAETWPYDDEYFSKWNRKRLKKDEFEVYPDFFLEKANEFHDVDTLIAEADIVNNIPIQKLDHLIAAKLDNGREKDLQDIVLMKDYIATPYQGIVIEESLLDPQWLDGVEIKNSVIAKTFHKHTVVCNYAHLAKLLTNLKAEKWHAHFWNADRIIVIFPQRMFVFTHSNQDSIRQQAIDYGGTLGIAEEKLQITNHELKGELSTLHLAL